MLLTFWVPVLLSPLLLAYVAKFILPGLGFWQRMAISIPQLLLYAISIIMLGRSDWFSKWHYLTHFSTVFGQPLGFLFVLLFVKRDAANSRP